MDRRGTNVLVADKRGRRCDQADPTRSGASFRPCRGTQLPAYQRKLRKCLRFSGPLAGAAARNRRSFARFPAQRSMPKLGDRTSDFEPFDAGFLLAAGEEVFGAADGAGPSMSAILIDHGSGRSSDLSARGQRRISDAIHIEKACGVLSGCRRLRSFSWICRSLRDND